jgi:NADH-quinone oxidoreductase subunit L
MVVDQLPLLTLVLPLLGTLLLLLGGRPGVRHEKPLRWPSWLATLTVLSSLGVSFGCFYEFRQLGSSLHLSLGEWIPGFGATLGLQMDGLSAALLLLVDGIGLMVFVYSLAYMREEKDQRRYYGCLLLFLAMMKLLVLADNYLLLFAGWEGVGLASYLLISYRHERYMAGHAATKAFLVNRIGDAGFLLGIFGLLQACGSLQFDVVAKRAGEIPHGAVVTITAALLIGALGKSAQIPLHVWLPDAMEGPTPVSALIHSATMVCAGVYLVARSGSLFAAAPEVSQGVAILGALTALFAATVALVENDIKRVLAYSTISQIGFMFMALGAGAFGVAIFHLVTHAFFKALLFLGAGSVIHALHDNQNLKQMGGLRKKMPVTFATMTIAALALAGVPGLAGFFSKDAVLSATLGAPNGWLLFAVGLGTSLLTACYAGRLIFLIFLCPPQRPAGHELVHESPALMLMPMGLLAAGCVFAGWLGPIGWREWPLMTLSGAVSLGGIWLAYHFYVSKPTTRDAMDIRFAGLAKVLRNRWYVDALYEERILDGLVLRAAWGADRADRHLLDGFVNGTAWAARRISKGSRWIDRYLIDGLVRGTSETLQFFSSPARAIQTGFVQTYALVFIVGLLAALGYYVAH